MRILAIILFSVGSIISSGQDYFLEVESENSSFQSEYKKSKPKEIFALGEDILVWYEANNRGMQTGEHYFRVFSNQMKHKKVKTQSLEKNTFINSLQQFANGDIVAIIYEYNGKKTLAMYAVRFDKSKLALDMENKTEIGVYTLQKKAYAMASLKSGDLFHVVSNPYSNYLGIVSSEASGRSQSYVYNYTIVDSEGNLKNSDKAEVDVKTREIGEIKWTISIDGDLFMTLADLSDYKKDVGTHHQLTSIKHKKNLEIGTKVHSLNDPFLATTSDGQSLIVFCTYIETKKDYKEGRTRGLYISKINLSDFSIESENYINFSQSVLDNVLDSKKRLIKQGSVGAHFDVIFLEENTKTNGFNFYIEPHTSFWNQNTGKVIYRSDSGILGEISQSFTDFNWIEVIKKEEKVARIDAVGSFVYLDNDNNMNVLFNCSKEEINKKGDGHPYYYNKSKTKSFVYHLSMDQSGNRTVKKMFNSKKDLGQFFIPYKAYQNPQTLQSFLILTKKQKEFLCYIAP